MGYKKVADTALQPALSGTAARPW